MEYSEEPVEPTPSPSEPEPPVEQSPRLDINTASADELSRLPGVTAAIAARIVDYRRKKGPFQEPAEVTRVRGVSQALYAQIARLITTEPPTEPAPLPEPVAVEALVEAEPVEPQPVEVEPVEVEPVAAQPVEAASTLPEPAAEPEPEPVAVPAPAARRAEPLDFGEFEPAPSRPGWLGTVVVGVVSALLGAFLAIALMLLINGTLQFGRATAINNLSSYVQQLDGRVAQMSATLDLAQARLDRGQADLEAMGQELKAMQGQLESLDADLNAVQTETKSLRAEMSGLGGSVAALEARAGALESQVAGISQEVRLMRSSVQRFDAFLSGLRAVLDEALPAPAATPLAPEPTAAVTPLAPEPTAGPTGTLSPLPTPTVVP